jgi:hypothetical protein
MVKITDSIFVARLHENTVEKVLPAETFEALEAYCPKATTGEMIDEAFRLLAVARMTPRC